MKFHDMDIDEERLTSLPKNVHKKYYGNRKFYAGTSLSQDYLNRWIRQNAENSVFLDYACGNGRIALKAARAGAKLAIGIDLSPRSIETARRNALHQGLQRPAFFMQADAEATGLPARCVDVIVCHGVLHHLDVARAFPELSRILNPGGIILAMEPLCYNPFIGFYRKLTPSMRTDWERSHIPRLSDLRLAKRFFHVQDLRFWHLTSVLTPYWKAGVPYFNALDRILTQIPIIRLWSWIFSFELIQSEERSSLSI